ncbi:hypothetical protein NDU88_005923 [Pleurodeles waltl]|uniref:Uncharacterized protein n=1 Tax=Pleurodeles waltl TaxID=8319 RepID=A0AAV7UJF2_PLEWA|nr:hypothetical protein NDU88_005923 [Pleurodeles waltl]
MSTSVYSHAAQRRTPAAGPSILCGLFRSKEAWVLSGMVSIGSEGPRSELSIKVKQGGVAESSRSQVSQDCMTRILKQEGKQKDIRNSCLFQLFRSTLKPTIEVLSEAFMRPGIAATNP